MDSNSHFGSAFFLLLTVKLKEQEKVRFQLHRLPHTHTISSMLTGCLLNIKNILTQHSSAAFETHATLFYAKTLSHASSCGHELQIDL